MNVHVRYANTELYSNWEMVWPCVSLVAVSVLGLVLGHGLDLLFRR